MESRLLDTLVPLVEVLESLGVAYQVGGSVASSVHGVARSSLDIDILAGLEPEHVHAFVAPLAETYYVSETRAADTVALGTGFNLIHLSTMFKVDVFVARASTFRRASLERR